MRSNGKRLKERICALMLAVIMPLTGILPEAMMSVHAEGSKVEITFEVTESNTNKKLKGVSIVISPTLGAIVNGTTDEEGVFTTTLDANMDYNYNMEKVGYNKVSGKITADGSENKKLELAMEIADIQVKESQVDLIVGETENITITNQIEDANYVWGTESGSECVSVDNGAVTAVKEGAANVTVTYGGKTTTIPVNVSKVDVTLGLTISPNSGNDTRSVECKVTGLADDATGNLTFCVNGIKKATIDSTESRTWTYEESDNIIDKMTFKVIYSGDSKYREASAEVNDAPFTKTKELILDSSEKAIRDDSKNKTYQIPVNAESIKGRTGKITYTSNDESVATVNETGEITINKAGKTQISVKAEADSKYAESIKHFTIIVQKVIKINEEKDKLEWISERVYDGTDDVLLTANLKGEKQVVGASAVKAVFEAKAEDKNVGTGKSATISSENIKITGIVEGKEVDLGEQYIIEFDKGKDTIIEGKVTIKGRPVYVGTGDVTLCYGQDIAEAVSKLSKDKEGNDIIKILDPDEETGVIAGEEKELKKDFIKAQLELNIDSKKVEYITYENVIRTNIPDIGKADGNYILYPASASEKYGVGKYGDLKVEQEKLSLTDIFDANESKVNINAEVDGVFVKGQSIYVRGQNSDSLNNGVNSSATLQISLKDNTYYQSVIMKAKDGQTYDLTEGCTFGGETRTIEGTIYFERENGLTTEETEFKVHIDADSPEVSMGKWTEKVRVVADWTQAITFNHYSSSYYTLENVTMKDYLPEQEVASGVSLEDKASWSYCVLRRKPDEKDGKYKEITADEIKSNKNSYSWTEIITDICDIPIATEEKGKLEELSDYYVVLVRAKDNVGNAVIYTSNGLVIDIQDPSISITDKDGGALFSDKIYNSDVDYKVTITDYEEPETGEKETATSGIKSFDLTVTNNGERTFPKNEKDIRHTVAGDKRYSIVDLQKLVKEYGEKVDAKANNSNDVSINVKATDQAGKEKEVTQSLMIDITKPGIDVYFENNDVSNGKYFNAERIMHVIFTERNFDKEKVTFDVQANANLSSLSEDHNVKVSQLVNYGIDAKWVSDTQDGKDISEFEEKQYSDNRTIELVLTFAADNEYYIVPHCKDKAGNINELVEYVDGTQAGEKFVIDKTAPIMEVTYTTEDADFAVSDVLDSQTDENKTNADVFAKISIKEKNFWTEAKEFSKNQLCFSKIEGTEAPGGITNYQEVVENKDNWSYNEGAPEITLEFKMDANYKVAFTYSDLAGNKAVYEPHYLTVDKTQPTGTISIDKQGFWSNVWSIITFNIFKNSDYQISLTSSDCTAGVKSTSYYKSATPITQKEVESLSENKWISGESFSVSPNEQYVVYERVIDRAGNIAFIYPTNGAVADDVKPTITIKNLSTPRNDIFRGDVTLNIDVADPTVGDTYSGLEKVWYTVESTGNMTNSLNEVLVDNSKNRQQGNQNWNGNITISAKDFNSNDVRVQAYATDFSGNTYESEIVPLKIDITEPTIRVDYDLNSPANGKYYNATRTATVTVIERNFDESAVQFNITNTDGVQAAISGWSRSTSSGVMDQATNTCTVTFAADGDYTITLKCTDLAGNQSNYTQVDEFTIDQTVPTINVTFDNNSAANAGYYDKPRTATVTVNEHNFNGSEVQAAISASLQSQGISAPGLNGWSTSGDSHATTIYFGTDGDYSFTINYTDLAGNTATTHTQEKFTVDQTKPEIEIFDILDKSANNDIVAPGVKYNDVNYDSQGVKITIKGAKHSEESITGTHSPITNGESIKMADFEHKEAVDDVYTLTAQISDLAGNVEEKSVVFSVNRFGSNYIFGDATKAFLDKYYSNKEQELIVTEINVDSLVHNGIAYGLDGEMVNLVKGTDYTVKESGNEASWKSYQYTIKASNFEKEGIYNVTVDSKDRANNEVNNKIKEANIEFVIDKTEPTVVITGVEKDGQYRTNNRDITIAVADNVAMDGLDVHVDGTESDSKHYSASAIQKQKGEIPFSLESSSNWQKIKATAVDAAGNTAETSEIRVLITSNLLVQLYRNTPVVVGSLVGLVALAAAIFVLVAKKKKTVQKDVEK